MPKKLDDWAEHGYTESDWKALTKFQRYSIRHPDRVKSSRKRYAENNRQYMSDRQRKYQLKGKYGITEKDYEDMLEAQHGKCAICYTDTPTGKWKRFAVDHCHHTGQVRGLLCNECNRGMGLLRDNAELLRNAADYLDHHRVITKQENNDRKQSKS